MSSKFVPGDSGAPLPTVDIPDHELLSVIGRGSYGQVWLARSTIGTYRAVKIVHRSSFTSRRPFEREMEGIKKFEPISRTHPGLVAILHVGQTSDQSCFYYIMELGDDVKNGVDIDPETYESKTLANSVWDRGGASIEKCIDLALSLSDALEFLHSRDLIHRDVKPANIVFVAGRPKLADIGLVTDARSAKTYVGTEGFIPPEGPNSRQGDIYSLGKTLYEVCTGMDRNQFPTLPAAFEEEAPDSQYIEMIEIINQACHHDTALRYPSARAMHAEITALANGKSIRRLRILERRMAGISRFSKVALAILLPVLLLAAAGYREWRNRIEDLHREIGRFEATATSEVDKSNYALGLKNFSEALILAPDDARNSELQRLRADAILNLMPTLTHAWQGPSSVNALAMDSSGEAVFVAGDQAHVARYSTKDLEKATLFEGHLGDVRALGYHEGRDLVVTGSQDNTARVWNAVTGQEIGAYHHDADLWAVAFGPDGSWFVTGGATDANEEARLTIWAVEDTDEPRREFVVDDPIWACAVSGDGNYVVAGRGKGAVTFWEVETGRQVEQELMHPGIVYSTVFINDDRKMITGCVDGRYRIWDLQTMSILYQSQPQNFAVRAVAGSPDGRFVSTAGWDLNVRMWRQGDGSLVDPILPHSGRVNTICYGPGGHRILTGTSDGAISVWDLAGQEMIRYVVGNWEPNSEGLLFGVPKESNDLLIREARPAQPMISKLKSVNRDDRRIVNSRGTVGFVCRKTAPDKSTLTAINLGSRQTIMDEVEVAFSEEIEQADLHLDKGVLVVSGGNLFQMFHVDDGSSLWPPQRRDSNLGHLYFSGSGQELFVELGNRVEILDANSFQPIGNGIETPAQVSFSILDPTDSVLAVCNSDFALARRSAYLYRFRESLKPYAELRHLDGVDRAAFRHDGLQIVTSSEDTSSVVWDVATGRRVGRPMKHRQGNGDARFSSDGRFVITSSSDRSARIWDAETMLPVTPPIPFPWPLYFGTISPDMDYLLTQSFGGGFSWTWSIGRNRYPPEVLRTYAEILCGEDGDDVANFGTNVERWRQVRSDYPKDFTITNAMVSRWHRAQAFDCLMELHRFPSEVRSEDYDSLLAAERFHHQRFQEQGRVDRAYDVYRLTVFEKNESKRVVEPDVQ